MRCTDTDEYIHHQQKATSVMNRGKLKYRSMLKTTICIWAKLTKTEWIIAIQL
jgi:hypothetical protein